MNTTLQRFTGDYVGEIRPGKVDEKRLAEIPGLDLTGTIFEKRGRV